MRFRDWALALVLALAAIVISLTCEAQTSPAAMAATARDYRVVHVFVALCDNRNQGIVPVPAALGNGQDPASNLYWGAQFGADAFFRRSEHWQPLALDGRPARPILARSAFVSRGPGSRVFVVMDAYDGAEMKAALTDFLRSAAGAVDGAVEATDGGARIRLAAWSAADLVCFVGHNGLMEVRPGVIPPSGPRGRFGTRGAPRPGATQPGAAVVLACKSNAWFKEPLRKAGCPPLITTAQLMAPEAYTLDAAIRSWAAGDRPDAVRERAAEAYAKYQRCSLPAARGVFVAGWGE